MKMYFVSLLAGLVVGVFYSLVGVRSPAPPVVALVGLLGILAGEQLPPLGRSFLQKEPVVQSWLYQIRPHMFGHLPRGQATPPPIMTQSFRAGPETDA